MVRGFLVAISLAVIFCPAVSSSAHEHPFPSPCPGANDGPTNSQLPTPILDYCQVVDEDSPIGQSRHPSFSSWLDAGLTTQRAVLLVTGVVP
jgi:hypothetical protein